MKIFSSGLLVFVFSACCHLAIADPQHRQVKQEAANSQDHTTVSIRQNDFALCGSPFYDEAYALTVEVFADGVESVDVEDFKQQLFALIRASDEFAGSAEAFVEHVKDIPAQLIQIIGEDPAVLESCESFSVALVGPL